MFALKYLAFSLILALTGILLVANFGISALTILIIIATADSIYAEITGNISLLTFGLFYNGQIEKWESGSG